MASSGNGKQPVVKTSKAKGGRTEAERQLHRLEVAKLFRRGWTMDRIAMHLNLPIDKVHSDWKAMVKEVMAVRDNEVKEKVVMMLEELAEVKAEAWEAWEKSKLDHEKEVVETSSSSKKPLKRGEDGKKNGANKFVKNIKSKEGRVPAGEYLKIVMCCLQEEADLQQLKPKKELHVDGQFSWDLLVKELKGEPRDAVEERLLTLAHQIETNNSTPPEPIDAEFEVVDGAGEVQEEGLEGENEGAED